MEKYFEVSSDLFDKYNRIYLYGAGYICKWFIGNFVGFTGGYNLADEYFNITHPYGYWKDTGIKLTGDAVRSLTASFLTMWNAIDHTDSQADYDKYLDAADNTYKAVDSECYVQPYSDNPLGQDR